MSISPVPTGLPYESIFDALGDGIYVTNLDREIVYWSPSAERLTGWRADEIIGRSCSDNVLCHIDFQGHPLCGKEFCPLHRAMVTGQGSEVPLVVFAQTPSRRPVAVQVSVAPLRDEMGQVIGGIEMFRDASQSMGEMERARAIQQSILTQQLPQTEHLRTRVHYVPHDVVGGDFYTIKDLGGDRFALLIADVMGHGTSAALYTMLLHGFMSESGIGLEHPLETMAFLNRRLHQLIGDQGSFATALYAVLDLRKGELEFVSAGHPNFLQVSSHGHWTCHEHSGMPLGLVAEAHHELNHCIVRPGDRFLFYTDGAMEISDVTGHYLSSESLMSMLDELGYSRRSVNLTEIEDALLRYSDRIRLDDDLTLIECEILG